MGHVISKSFRTAENLQEKIVMIEDSPIITDDHFYENDLEREDFDQKLTDQYSDILPTFNEDSLHQALLKSLFNPTNPQPLVLRIQNTQSLAAHIFKDVLLDSEPLQAYLEVQFCTWTCDLTDNNYHELLSIVSTEVGEEVAAVIDSTPTDLYPLMICLIFDRGQIKIESVIQSDTLEDEVFARLIRTREAFSARLDLPDTTGLSLRSIDRENWSIPPSTLFEVPNLSDEFRRVAEDFDGGESSIVRIDRIENIVWLMQYLSQKETIDARVGHDVTEKLLFHGCPDSSAQNILKQGFDHQRIGRNGSVYGQGFYFSTSRRTSDGYALPNPVTREKTILMCRVLVGRSCRGNGTMSLCPSNYDSTTDEKDIHVVYSNRHVLPEYLITYK